jgi:PAS domain S-box-containing protein
MKPRREKPFLELTDTFLSAKKIGKSGQAKPKDSITPVEVKSAGVGRAVAKRKKRKKGPENPALLILFQLDTGMRVQGKVGIAVACLLVAGGAAGVWAHFKSAQDTRVYRVGFNEDMPFHFLGADGRPMGIAVGIVSAGAARSGVRIEWRKTPHSGVQAIQQDGVDFWVLLTDLPERRAFVHFTEPYLTAERCFVVLTEGKAKTLENLPHSRIGYRALTPAFGAPLAENNPNADLIYLRQQFPAATPVAIPYSLDAGLWQVLSSGAVDVLMVSKTVAMTMLLAGGSRQKMEMLAAPDVPYRLALASSFATQEAADRIRDGIRDMAEDGTLSGIVQNSGFVQSVNLDIIEGLARARRTARLLAGGTVLLLLSVAGASLMALRLRRQRDVVGRTQSELQRANVRFALVSNCVPDVIWSMDLAGRFTYVSSSVERMYGWTAEAFLKLSPKDVLSATHFERGFAILRQRLEAAASPQFERGRVLVLEMEHQRKDGSLFWVELNTTLNWSEDGRPTGVTGVARDITERKRAEEERERLWAQLSQAQKMESIGRLAGGVAHDFNNLLTVINGYSGLLLKGVNPGDAAAGPLGEIHKAGERAAQLTRQLLAFSRKQEVEWKRVDLNALILETRTMLQRMVGEDIEIAVELSPDAGPVQADTGHLTQVLMNLAVNARDAMPEGGRLSIETANSDLDGAYAAAHPGIAAGRYVRVAVRDTGAGIDEETQARIFEPFFTTKGPGKGTGLGLSTVYGIVRQAGGSIDVESDPGKGTAFLIYLPSPWQGGIAPPAQQPGPGKEENGHRLFVSGLEDMPESDAAEPTPAEVEPGTETILLVEDQEELRRLAALGLRHHGYRILDAGCGDEALLVAGQHEGPIHLLLTDMVMPGMNGEELAKQLKAVRPEAKVLYMSGYAGDRVTVEELRETGGAFLAKPFTMDVLAAKVRAVLGNGRGQTA